MHTPSGTTLNDLIFRRQFYLGPEIPDLLSGWSQPPTVDSLHLSVHPDLPHTRADTDGRSLVLLGYALDPRHPHRSNQDIVDNTLRVGRKFDDLLRALRPLAGRWAAAFLAEGKLVVLHDAVGSRQVAYCRDDDGAVRIASSPGLLARVTGRPKDTQAVQQLVDEDVFRKGFTHFWPGDGSAVVGVNRLLPNHCLDARTGQVQRYWPSAAITTVDTDEGAALSRTTLTGAISAAAARYPLALSLTAGFDSRLLLAASRAVAPDIAFYTYKKPGKSAMSPDIRVPRRILGDLGLRHKVVTVKPLSGGPVFDAISASISPLHPNSASQAAALLADAPIPEGAWVTLNGNVAEVAQCRLQRLPVTPENLATNARMPGSSYAMKHLTQWHSQAAPALDTSGVDPWDLLYWEHKMGGWYATIRTEFDVVEEVVTPYNSREWLEGMLGVDPAVRSAPEWTFFRSLIGELWPQLLDYPFNPPDTVGALYHRARNVAKAAAGRVRPPHSPARQG